MDGQADSDVAFGILRRELRDEGFERPVTAQIGMV